MINHRDYQIGGDIHSRIQEWVGGGGAWRVNSKDNLRSSLYRQEWIKQTSLRMFCSPALVLQQLCNNLMWISC
jgi:hypothetical protein